MFLTRRSLAPFAAVLLGLALMLAACGGSSTAHAPDATTLIQTANDNFARDNTLHFAITASNIAPGLYSVTDGNGDVMRPDKMKVLGSVEASKGLSVGIGIVIIGTDQYVDLGATGKYMQSNGLLPNLVAIFDPNNGIGAILKQFQNATPPVADTLNGLATWKTTGTVPSTALNPITGSTSTTATPIMTTLWVGQADGQIHQVKLVGNAITGDTDQSTRIFTLSNFNQPVTIAVPPLK